jgi:hypothetical protein
MMKLKVGTCGSYSERYSPLAAHVHGITVPNVRNSGDYDQSFQRIATSVTLVREGTVG